MARSRRRATRANERWRLEFNRRHRELVLEQYRRHPKPRCAGTLLQLRERGDEAELFGDRR